MQKHIQTKSAIILQCYGPVGTQPIQHIDK